MSLELYKNPKYYEIAFSFINVKKQVNLFEEFIKKYSKINVKSILDIACGTSLQLREFARRNYRCIGLDMNKEMLNYLKKEAKKEKLDIETIKANMINFSLKNKVDFAFILMGSIIYIKSNAELMNLLKSVSNSLNSGGLFLIENLPMTWSNPKFWEKQIWTINHKNIKITTTYKITPKDDINQIIHQDITLKVNDNGHRIIIRDEGDFKIIFPQELKTIIDLEGNFEFIGFFERGKVRQLKKASANSIILIRKK